MFNRSKYLLSSIITVGLATGLGACESSEEGEDAGYDMSTGDATGTDTIETDTTGADGSGDTAVEDTTPAGACTSAGDMTIIESTDADPAEEGDQTVTGVAQGCGLGCLGEDDPSACAVTCIVDKTGVSQPCAGCYGLVVACSIENCLASCALDPASEACATCQGEFCLPAFYECTGLEVPTEGSGEGSGGN